jgi:hypothetical protein
MDCKQCSGNLTAYQDSELSAIEADEVRRHLQVCASCAEELRSLRKTSEYIESRIRELNPKPETWNLVRARIADAEISYSPWRFFLQHWRPATAAMTIFLVAGAGYMQYRQVERRSLDQYISKYVQERNTRIRIKSILTKYKMGVEMESPYADNPFIEAKATFTENPFRLEDR